MAALKDIVVDCAHPASLARFWAAALDGYVIRPYDDEEIARLRAMGIDDVEDDPSVALDSADGKSTIFFQRVPEPKTVKNRVHLDLLTPDRAAEVRRLCALGARVLWELDSNVTLADPEGNEFCVMQQP